MDDNRRFLTDRFLRSFTASSSAVSASKSGTLIVPGFGIRGLATSRTTTRRAGKAGKISFVLYARFSPGAAPTRRVIGVYPAITLEDARRAAGEWRSQIARGIDPRVVEEGRERERGRARGRHCASAIRSARSPETFIADKLSQERSGKVTERTTAQRLHRGMARADPSARSPRSTCWNIINTKKRTAPKMAGNYCWIIIRRFFNWVIDQRVYGLTASPCDRLSVVKLVGPMSARGPYASTTTNCAHSGEPPSG